MTVSHPFFKSEHSLRKLLIHLLGRIWIVRIRMMAVEKLHDVEAAAVHIEVDIPLFKKTKAQGVRKTHCAINGIGTGYGTGHIAAGDRQFRAIRTLQVIPHLSRVFDTRYSTKSLKANTMLL